MPADYDDYDPSRCSLDDVCGKLDSIDETLRDTRSGFVGLAWTALLLIAIFVWIPDLWHTKTRYAWSHGVSTDQVTIDKRPKDCDFFHAPIGDKACKYKRQVSTVQVKSEYSATTGAVHYVSYDDGKTWSVDTSVPATQPQVSISWEKVEDQ